MKFKLKQRAALASLKDIDKTSTETTLATLPEKATPEQIVDLLKSIKAPLIKILTFAKLFTSAKTDAVINWIIVLLNVPAPVEGEVKSVPVDEPPISEEAERT